MKYLRCNQRLNIFYRIQQINASESTGLDNILEHSDLQITLDSESGDPVPHLLQY